MLAVGAWCHLACCAPTDLDDCADAPCCWQVCTNTPGGYECSCYAGYRLSTDGCGCEGEWRQEGPQGTLCLGVRAACGAVLTCPSLPDL